MVDVPLVRAEVIRWLLLEFEKSHIFRSLLFLPPWDDAETLACGVGRASPHEQVYETLLVINMILTKLFCYSLLVYEFAEFSLTQNPNNHVSSSSQASC